MKRLLIITILIMCATNCLARKDVDNAPVDSLSKERYMGLWYEIARLNHPFERGMKNVTARYTALADGRIEVLNSGDKNGRRKISKGVAKTTKQEGVLKVKFFLFYSPYIVMNIDTDAYSYALVGSSSSKYLWILARTPQLPKATLDMLIEDARVRGYDIDELIFPQQKGIE